MNFEQGRLGSSNVNQRAWRVVPANESTLNPFFVASCIAGTAIPFIYATCDVPSAKENCNPQIPSSSSILAINQRVNEVANDECVATTVG